MKKRPTHASRGTKASGSNPQPSCGGPLSQTREGVGPLLQRDYWAVIRSSRASPREIGALLTHRFSDFAPEEWVRFQRHDGSSAPLAGNQRLDVQIRGVGPCEVQVIHQNAQSLTLATVLGHPEAGRITFGAYRSSTGAVIFHIRSRARASTLRNYLGFLGPGDPMQTSTWSDFVDRVAATVGDGVDGEIHVETHPIEDEPEETAMHEPTYFATGD